MKDGFVRVAAGTPSIRVGDTEGNAKEIVRLIELASTAHAKVLVLPELCLTGYTAGDLFLQRTLQMGVLDALDAIVKATRLHDVLVFVGAPIIVDDRLYNCAIAIKNAEILGVVPKRNPPNYGEFYELRHFAPGDAAVREIVLLGHKVPFGGDVVFACDEMSELKVACEICEDLWVPRAPSIGHALAGATLIVNLSASDETAGKPAYREMLVKSQSARLICAYVYADAGEGESSTDMVFSGHNLISENGVVLASSKRYENAMVTADVDLAYLASERLRMNTFGRCESEHVRVPFHVKMETLTLDRFVDPAPFVPAGETRRARRCEEILDIQTHGLMTRMKHIGTDKLLIGASGGLDSTLAMIVASRALEKLGHDPKGLIAVTMPCFGTTSRTKGNAIKLAEGMNATLMDIDIKAAVTQHLHDIGHDLDTHDVTYENAQARERTKVLMDLSNKLGGIVVGTGDLSELALGWATYNGDHMSMYGVNGGVPKTLVKHLVAYACDQAEPGPFKDALADVLDTPVSPELLPPKDGVISQVTEDYVGPYALHDFYLYHIVRRMEPPKKVARLAAIAFDAEYDAEEINKWLHVFVKRFFSQQFKRSCLPDGPKVGSVALSPRGDWRMPSDGCGKLWQKVQKKNA